ncbi:MAG: CocE/NonD family hydrolase, partial [Telluria sp.]
MKIALAILYFLLCVWGSAAAHASNATPEYDVQDKIVLKTRDGATVSGMLVRRKDGATTLPTALQF